MLAIDETLTRRRGPKVFAASWWHDGSAAGAKKIGYGNSWVVLAIVVTHCQDNEISWYNCSAMNGQQLTEFTRQLTAVKRAHRTLRRPAFLTGAGDPPDIAWFDGLGRPMAPDRWNDPPTISWRTCGAATPPSSPTTTC